MFCPRCGRAMNETANFCGGCGLSRVEIEKFAQAAKVANEAAQQTAASETPKTDEVKSEVPFGTIVNEPVTVAEAQPQQETVAETSEKTDEQLLKEIVTDAAETEKAQPEQHIPQPEAPKEQPAQTYTYTAPAGAEYRWSANSSTNTAAQTDTTAQTSYAQPAAKVKNENLSTVDFIWMMLISSIPVVGLIYIIYLAIQDNNTNKRSYARATLIISVFATVVALVFTLGFIIAGL